MASAKTTKKKNTKVTKKPEVEQVEEERDEEVLPTKAKKPIEIDEPEPLLPLDEKVEDVLAPVDEESESDEEGLAEDEIDPFGDKWEL